MTINASKLIYKTASCPAFGDWAIKNGLTKKYSEAKKGDIVLFDFNHNGTSDHIGIVEKANNDGSITTIEGNTSLTSNDNGGCVMRRTRYKSQVNYIVRPKYTSEVTADMLVETAKAEIGVKESPAGSNKQKYGAWMGANGVPWCACYVCWLYAHVKGEAEPISKPNTKYMGSLPTIDIRKGSEGKQVGYWQDFLNFYHPEWKLKRDEEFGVLTDEATAEFQRTEGLEPDGCVGPLTRAKAKTYVAETAVVKTKAETLVETAKKLAWAKGTAKNTYYSKPKTAFKTALEKAYPDRSKWGTDARNGKSCDVALGVIMRTSGVDKNYPRGYDEQEKYVKQHTELYSQISIKNARAGDIVQYERNDGGVHTGLITGKYFAEASHGDFYLAIRDVKKSRLSTSGKKYLRVYRVKESPQKVKLSGIDISVHQDKLSDAAVETIANNYDFVILRMGIRYYADLKNTLDSVFEYNYNKLNGKVPLGAYFYSRAITKKEAEEEAIFCIEHSQNKNFDWPIYLDVEDKRQSAISKDRLTEVINVWCAAMRNSGIKFGIYSGMNMLNNKIDVSKLPSDCSIWVAQYPNVMTEKSAYTGKHDIWQYSSSKKVSHIAGNIDANYCYRDFTK